MPHLPISIPAAPPQPASGILKVKGNQIVDQNDNEVFLRGAGIGGHLNMENFITGYPGHEYGMRRALKKVLGEEKYDYFFDKFLEYFFTEKDAEFFASLGLNCIRVPFNYRHFEDDLNPGVYNERGFQWLDRIINICAKHGIYTILDLHAAPGGQNIDWHCDTGVHRALFWEYIEFQNRAIALWEKLAERYKGNAWVAGYNPLNEPTDEEHVRVLAWYDKCEKAIRKIDPDHVLFWDGNTWAADFSHFKDPLPNSVYSIHDYSNYGFPDGERYKATPEQVAKMNRSFERKCEYQKGINGPIWNGEFGPVYANPSDGPEWETINSERYHVLKDQLTIYSKARISWSIWLYKDIGFQGMVHTDPTGAYMTRFADFLAKKKRLCADEWGADTKAVKHIFDPLQEWILKEVPNFKNRYPPMWTPTHHVGRVVRNILLSEELYPEYADHFKDLTLDQLDELAASFKFENCVQRQGLNEVLREHAKLTSGN
jgi:hypothetical protein